MAGLAHFSTKALVRRGVRVLEPRDGRINSGFYDYFTSTIDQAKEEIIVTGEGFDYSTSEGSQAANRYNEAMERALRRGIPVTRIQTGRPLSERWALQLKTLKSKYRERFNLYILDNNYSQDIASVCVVDPDRVRCVTEMMLSTEKDLGGLATRLASTALFIHRRRELARAMKANIMAITTAKIAKHIDDADEIDMFIEANRGRVLYFSFGSNMSSSQMARRCPTAEKLSNGEIRGMEIVFNRIGDYRDGGVASIATSNSKKAKVCGVIWSVSRDELEALDAEEIPTSYRRITLPVLRHDDGTNVDCEVYVAFPEPGPIHPDAEYLELMISAAKSADLPDSCILRLEDFRS